MINWRSVTAVVERAGMAVAAIVWWYGEEEGVVIGWLGVAERNWRS